MKGALIVTAEFFGLFVVGDSQISLISVVSETHFSCNTAGHE